MDKETNEFIEAQNKALLEDVVSVIRDLSAMISSQAQALDTRLGRIESTVEKTDKRMVGLEARMDGVEVRTGRMEGNFAALEQSVERRFIALENEAREIKSAVLNIEHVLQDKQEAQGDELADTRQRVARIGDRMGLPHSLSAAA